jgi:hypothetical protein
LWGRRPHFFVRQSRSGGQVHVGNDRTPILFGFLARLLPPEHRIYFTCVVTLVAALLLALARCWI